MLEASFWEGKVRTKQAERTWERIAAELKRLNSVRSAEITAGLLAAIAQTTAAGSRSRMECCKVFKRLARCARIPDIDLKAIDAVKTPYVPAERDLPTLDQLEALINQTRNHKQYGWMTAGLIIYGCRPGEIGSLQPDANGTARCVTIKEKGVLPKWRTALALPVDWIEKFDLLDVNNPFAFDSPSDYDSDLSHRQTQNWGKWIKRQLDGLQLYDCRHAWAVRSIYENLNASFAAKCMGHSLDIHNRSYHRYFTERDAVAVAAQLMAAKQG